MRARTHSMQCSGAMAAQTGRACAVTEIKHVTSNHVVVVGSWLNAVAVWGRRADSVSPPTVPNYHLVNLLVLHLSDVIPVGVIWRQTAWWGGGRAPPTRQEWGGARP